jgi:hypothetical protein
LLSIFNFWFSILLQYYINDQNYNCCVLKHLHLFCCPSLIFHCITILH